jgi:hypothetical protein
MQTMVRGHTIQVDPQLICSVLKVPILPVSGVPFRLGVEAPSMTFSVISLVLDLKGRRSPTLRSVLELFPLCTSSWQK